MHVHTVTLHVLDIARCRLSETLPVLITLIIITVSLNSGLYLYCADSVSTIFIRMSWFLHDTVIMMGYGVIINHY